MNNQQYAIFIDFDGTCVTHLGSLDYMVTEQPEILPGVRDKFQEWNERGCYIIITTARPQWAEKVTRQQLEQLGLEYNRLIMEVTNLPRVLINDEKPSIKETAIGITIPRDKGISHIEI